MLKNLTQWTCMASTGCKPKWSYIICFLSRVAAQSSPPNSWILQWDEPEIVNCDASYLDLVTIRFVPNVFV